MTPTGFDLVRKLGLALPGVEEETYYGSPALKIGKRLLACIAIHRSAEPGSLVVRTDFETRAALVDEESSIFYVTEHYRNHPVVLVRLSKIKEDQMRDLLQAAWRIIVDHQKRLGSKKTRTL